LLPSFEVENFRTFSHLQIPHLGGVNLIVGRNNVGKTMLLEALRLYAAEGDINAILGLLYDSDELLPLSGFEVEPHNVQLRFASLFHGRVLPSASKSAIVLQTNPQDVHRVQIAIDFRPVSGKRDSSDYRSTTTLPPLEEEDVMLPVITVQVGEGAPNVYSLAFSIRPNREGWAVDKKRLSLAFVPAGGVDSKTLVRQWDAIALHTAAEEQVIECLRVVAPIERVTSVEHPANPSQRMFLARIRGASEPVPLKSLGDGMVRVFQFALALESAKSKQAGMGASPRPLVSNAASTDVDGTFLIDEVDNGIHYTVLPNLWRFLFRMARLHKLQIFATTHSWDCVEAFQKAAAEERETEGMLLRLEKRDDCCEHKVVTYTEQELASATRFDTEVR
jgi:hypothetical protein